MVDTAEGTRCHGVVSVALYDVPTLNAYCQEWRRFPHQLKLDLLDSIEPVATSTSANVTCVGLHEWITDALHASTSNPSDPVEVALGRSADQPSSTDTRLNDEVARIDITEFANETTQVRINVFVGEHEANVDVDAGETLSEVGIYTEDDRLLNHALLPTQYEKDETKTMSIEIVLSFTHA